MRNISPITAQQDPSGKERGAAILELRPHWMRNFSPIIAQQDLIGDGTRNRWNQSEGHAEQPATLPPSRICESDWENGERLIEEAVLQPQI
jgi:hypothetical protein